MFKYCCFFIQLLIFSLIVSAENTTAPENKNTSPQSRLASVKASNTKNTPSITKNSPSILVFGDSLSAAYNIKHDEGWVSLLQNFLSKQKIQAKITNASISGETTGGGLERINQQLNISQANIVILELGANDGLRGYDLELAHSNLKKMISISQQHGAKVILAGMRIPPNFGRTYTKKFNRIFEILGNQDDVILIPFFLDNVASIDALMQPDKLHPNSHAQPVIMQTVWKYLSPLLLQ